MANANDFMRQLHAQTSGGEEGKQRQDRAIMRILGSWIRNRTTEYLSFGDGDAAYLGSHAKKAGVDKETAREMTRKILEKTYDPASVDEVMMPEFEDAYDVAEVEDWWRQKCFGFIK